MRTVGPRTNLKKTYPRCHYNSKGKSKKQFATEKEAEEYIVSHKLEGYTIYECKVCHMFHISHKNNKKENENETKADEGDAGPAYNGKRIGNAQYRIQNKEKPRITKRRA